ncbi:alpha/beta hydrolase [Streptomyces sp. J2-1]|nr:alpha/beta hydrolase [Streptomyces corallincola]
MTDLEIGLPGGRRLRVYDTGPAGGPVVLWQHGTPNVGTPPRPLFAASARLGVRWVGFDRPGYGGSTRVPGRTLGSVAGDAARVADALGIGRFAVLGHSGGASHALACAAVLRDRVTAVAAGSGLAPYGAAGLDWFAGMAPSCRASLTAAVAGRAAKERHVATADYDPEMFTPADHAALAGPWKWFAEVVGPAVAGGPDGLIDDDLAYVRPWGCDPATATAPVLILHGGRDRVVPVSHGRWLAARCPGAEFRERPEDGHLSALAGAEAALEWLVERAAP